jgi:hypothetical protein
MKKINLKVLATALATLTISGCTADQLENFRENYARSANAVSPPQQVIIVQQPDHLEDSILEHQAEIYSAASRALSNDTSAAIRSIPYR